ncbi:arginine--tRNA ligase [Candidatus Woesearchaeota archaeon]|nr:MAG: arginine--tRNA ligase [Candidatus Woesearchaeota archaeon]
MEKFKEIVIKILEDYFGNTFSREELESSVKIQDVSGKKRNPNFGEIAYQIFDFAKLCELNDASSLAREVADELTLDERISRVEAVGPYINFHFDRNALIEGILNEVEEEGEKFGSNNSGEGKLVVLDYSAPNIGKPLHVGHIRSTILGDSIIRILNFNGYKTHGINYLGDVGLHIGKIIYAFKQWGDSAKIEANPEQEILDLYIKFCKLEEKDEALTKKAKKEVELLEKGDLESKRIHRFIEEMSLRAFDRVYDMLNVSFDETTGQSRFSEKGKQVIHEALKKGKAELTEDGAVAVDLSEYGLPRKMVLRSDGTAIYSTQDIGAAIHRKERFDFDKLLYVVATEQELYFKQLFAILDKFGYKWAKNCFHVNFGMINLPEGRMSTREGALVYLEEVLNKSIDAARRIIEEKSPGIPNKDEVARMVGVGAVKYMVLSVDYSKPIEFSWDRALNIEGNSAPYIQYSFARANSILERIGRKPEGFSPEHLDTDIEFDLVRKIGMLPTAVKFAGLGYKPHIIANYANELSGMFNTFYNKVRVKDSGEKLGSRLRLVSAYMTAVQNAMSLLGIKMPRKM